MSVSRIILIALVIFCQDILFANADRGASFKPYNSVNEDEHGLTFRKKDKEFNPSTIKVQCSFLCLDFEDCRRFFVENGSCFLGFIGEGLTVPETAVQEVNAPERRAWKKGKMEYTVISIASAPHE